jgi:aspartate aminotransferase
MTSNYQAADRVRNLTGSATVSIMDKAKRLQAQGRSIIDLSGGEPDFPTAPHIIQAGVQAMESGFTHYVASQGIPELRRAIARKLETENGVTFNPQNEILVTPGGKQAIFVAAQALLSPGDEVILFDPCWVSYAPCVELAGAVPIYVSMNIPVNAFQLKADLAHAITPHTRLIIVNTPNNPTGLVWTAELLQIVADIAQTHDLLVLSDEIYEKIVYDDLKHLSIAALPNMTERTLVVNGMSKGYAMTGWRMGYIAGPQRLIADMLKIYQHSMTCATSFVQKAAVVALEGPQEYIGYLVNRYKVRRDNLVACLNSVPGIHCESPQGAFYAFPNITETGLTSIEFGDRLLESEGVAVTPGIAFGSSGNNFVRLSFANSDEMLAEGGERIRRFVTNLR